MKETGLDYFLIHCERCVSLVLFSPMTEVRWTCLMAMLSSDNSDPCRFWKRSIWWLEVTFYKHSQSIWEELSHFISKNCSLMHSVKTVQGFSFTIGIPHRMRYKSFNNRYKIFFGHKKPYQLETQQDQCKVRLEIVISREITLSL